MRQFYDPIDLSDWSMTQANLSKSTLPANTGMDARQLQARLLALEAKLNHPSFSAMSERDPSFLAISPGQSAQPINQSTNESTCLHSQPHSQPHSQSNSWYESLLKIQLPSSMHIAVWILVALVALIVIICIIHLATRNNHVMIDPRYMGYVPFKNERQY